jgi:hypothetical protein
MRAVAGERPHHPGARRGVIRHLVGSDIAFPKTSWNTVAILRLPLALDSVAPPERLDEAGSVPVADVLDAAVAVWSARRYVHCQAESLPPGRVRGQRQVIWY